jgi:hypothetical protein
MPTKGNAPMPSCNKADQEAILSVMRTFRGDKHAAAERFRALLGDKELCVLMHSLRRWYTSWSTGSKLRGYRMVLSTVMDLNPPIGVFRGFKVPVDDPLARVVPGARLTLPVTRNGGCSSWTTKRELANKFSGASRGKVGLVVKLVGGRNVQAFIAPPERTVGWFNELYTRTMSGSHRNTEHEYTIYAPRVEVEVVCVKRVGQPACERRVAQHANDSTANTGIRDALRAIIASRFR